MILILIGCLWFGVIWNLLRARQFRWQLEEVKVKTNSWALAIQGENRDLLRRLEAVEDLVAEDGDDE